MSRIITFFNHKILLPFFVCIAVNADSQNVSSYTFTQKQEAWTSISADSNAVLVNNFIFWDEPYGPFPIGFNFPYHGIPYDSFGFTDNALVGIGHVPTWDLHAFGSVEANDIGACNMQLSGLYDNPNGPVAEFYEIKGTSPNCVLIIEWDGLIPGLWGHDPANDIYSMQMKLYETTGEIDVVYNIIDSIDPQGYLIPQVGLTGDTVSDFNLRAGTTNPWNSSTAALADSIGEWIYTGNTPSIGWTYIWIPPNGPPVAAFASDAPLCAGDSVNFTDNSTNNPVSWQWSFPGGAPDTSSSENPLGISYKDSGSYDVTLIVSNSFGSDTLTLSNYVTVYSRPSIGVNPSAPAVCMGQSVELAASGASTYSWSPSAGLSSSSGDSVTTATDSTTTYTVRGTDIHGCVNTSSVTVTVNPLPVINAGPDVTICAHDSTQLNVTGAPSGSTWSWMPTTGLSCNNCANPVANPSTPTTYQVIATSPAGCSGRDTIMVNVASVNAVASNDTSVCPGSTVQLHASGGTTYTWMPSTGLTNSGISDPMAIPDTTITYTVTVANGNCNAMVAVTITVLATPPIAIIPSPTHDTLYCTTDTAYTSYQWYNDNVKIPGDTGTWIIITKSGNYNVQVTNRNGCSSGVGINVIVDSTSGIQQYALDNTISLYPNPVKNEFTIYDSRFTIERIDIYNMLGQVCQQSEIENRKSEIVIDLSKFESGIYFVSVTDENNRWVGKVVKE